MAPQTARLDNGRDLQVLWVSLLQRPWSSLVVVPTELPLTAREVTHGLAELAGYSDLAQVETMDAVGISIAKGGELARLLGERVAQGRRVVVLVEPLTQSVASLPLVAVAQRALLVVRYGSTMAAAKDTVDLIGREKVLGAVALPPNP